MIAVLIWPIGEGFAEPPKSAVLAETALGVESRSYNQTNQHQYGPDQLPVPVRIIEDPNEAQHTRDREQKSDEHEAADLKAQELAASAAQRSAVAGEGQEAAAFWQLWIAGFGTAALLYSLWLTRRSLKQTELANETAQKAFAASQRAWIKTSIVAESEFEIRRHGVELLVVAVNENIGNAPALRAHTIIKAISDLSEIPETVTRLSEEGKTGDGAQYGITLLPEDKFHRPWSISLALDELTNAVGYPKVCPIIVCCVTYETANDMVKHQTCSVFMLGTKLSQFGDTVGHVDINGQWVPKEQLRIVQWAGGHAN